MTQNQLHHSRISTHRFLLNKTDTQTEPPELIHERREKDIDPPLPFYPDLISREFPGITGGETFIDHAMTSLKSSKKFQAMAIKMDDFGPRPDISRKDHAAEVLVDIGKIIETLCNDLGGLWGPIDRNMFACYIPEQNGTSGETVAQNIQKELSEKRPETVTIGIASYPTINYERQQVLPNARKALDHAAFFGPGSKVCFDAVTLNISGDILYQKGDIQGACKEFETALELDPKDVNIHNSLGVCYGVEKKYEKALNAFEKSVHLAPKEVMALFNLGLVNMLMENKEKALDFFLEANEIDSNLFEVAFQTGRLYLEMKKPEDAKAFLEKTTDLKTDSGAAFRFLGDCYGDLDMTTEAIDAYKKAVKLNPNDAAALSAMGHLFEISGENPDIALMFCKQSVEIAPENGLFRHRLAHRYLNQGRLEDALKEFEEAQNLGHDSAEFIEKIQTILEADRN